MSYAIIIRGGTPSERHLMEHLILCRSKEFPKPYQLYQFLFTKGVQIDRMSYYDYAEITFWGDDKTIEHVEKALNTWYCNPSDCKVEKRIFEIECLGYDEKSANIDRIKFPYIKQGSVCDTEYLVSNLYKKYKKLSNVCKTELVHIPKASGVKSKRIASLSLKKWINKNVSFQTFKQKGWVTYLFPPHTDWYDIVLLLERCWKLSHKERNLRFLFSEEGAAVSIPSITQLRMLSLAVKEYGIQAIKEHKINPFGDIVRSYITKSSYLPNHYAEKEILDILEFTLNYIITIYENNERIKK